MTAHNDEADRAAADGGPRAYTLGEIQAMPPAPGMAARRKPWNRGDVEANRNRDEVDS